MPAILVKGRDSKAKIQGIVGFVNQDNITPYFKSNGIYPEKVKIIQFQYPVCLVVYLSFNFLHAPSLDVFT